MTTSRTGSGSFQMDAFMMLTSGTTYIHMQTQAYMPECKLLPQEHVYQSINQSINNQSVQAVEQTANSSTTSAGYASRQSTFLPDVLPPTTAHMYFPGRVASLSVVVTETIATFLQSLVVLELSRRVIVVLACCPVVGGSLTALLIDAGALQQALIVGLEVEACIWWALEQRLHILPKFDMSVMNLE
jgi:hypothetical protein